VFGTMAEATSHAPMNPLHATIEDFAADGYTHIECYCPHCREIRLRPISWLPRLSLGLTLAQLSTRLRCAECGGPLRSAKPWRHNALMM
jgi:phage FluMu protein Com